MRILQVFNDYKIDGGEKKVVQLEKELLESHQHSVFQFLRSNKQSINSFSSKVSLLFNTHYNKKIKKDFRACLEETKADIVHVHNVFPLISPSIFDVCQELNVPVVMTMHNYRILYPNGLMYANGQVDTRTISGSAYITVPDKVYRNSMIQTAVLAHFIEYHKRKDTWNKKLNKIIALTEFSREIFETFGVKPEKLVVKPNFLSDPARDENKNVIVSSTKDYFVFIGRLSQEKGVKFLVESWISQKISYKLIIIGGGDLKTDLEKLLSENECDIELLGEIQNADALEYLRNSKYMIFPSQWYEGFPMTILEAFSMGIPIITSDIGNHGVLIEDGFTGFKFVNKDQESLREAVVKASDIEKNSYEEISQNCIDQYMSKYSAHQNYSMLMGIYNDLIGNDRED